MKDDLPFFSHENNAVNNARMKALRAQYGWEGYGRFWALNEAIARCNNVRLDLSAKVQRSSLANDLGLTTAQLDEFLTFLADPEECGLIHYVDGIVTTEKTQEDHARVMAERNRKRKDRAPVTDSFPDFHGSSSEELENGAEDRENGAPKHHIQEERREDKSRSSSPEAELEEFAPSEKSDAEKPVENLEPPKAPVSSPADDFDPIPTLNVPEGVRFTRKDLLELFQATGSQAQAHLDRFALAKQAKGYGFKNDWAGMKYFWDRAGSADAWIAGTPKAEGHTQRPEAYRPLNSGRAPDGTVVIEASAKDFIREAQAAKRAGVG